MKVAFILFLVILKMSKGDKNMNTCRTATHSGSWYNASGTELSTQLENWLSAVNETHGPARAIIAPHAGYSYSGPCAAYAYKQIDPTHIKRIFILGPSHHARLQGCALTTADTYETPLYDLPIDTKMNRELLSAGEFALMKMSVDEAEHSIEMQLPYIAKIMENHQNQFNIVPILVGVINTETTNMYAQILSKYLLNPENLFVISSDFCHWGNRFDYTYYDHSFKNIYESIENIDRIGMDIIRDLNPNEFSKYLNNYGNTICGRNPIQILLQSLQILLKTNSRINANLKFLKYYQSNKVTKNNDSSVSYAAASLTLT